MVKNLPVMPDTWVQSLGGEDALEKEMATCSSILAWRIPWTEEPGGAHPCRKESDTTEQLTTVNIIVSTCSPWINQVHRLQHTGGQLIS